MKTHVSVRTLLLIFTILLPTIPILLFGTLQVFEEFEEANKHAAEMNQRTARLIQQQIEGGVNQIRALIEAASADIDLKSLRPRQPEKLKALLHDYPTIMAFIISDADAKSVGAYSLSMEVPIGYDYSDRPQIIEARRTKRTAISGNLTGRATNIASVIAVVPLLDERQEVHGFFSAALPPGKLGGTLKLSPDEFAVVTDSFGRLLVTDRGQTSLTEAQLADVAKRLAVAAEGPNPYKLDGADIDVQVVSVHPIGWKVFVGVAPEFIQARAWTALRRSGLLALISALIGVSIISLLSFKSARSVANVGAQLDRMSSSDIQPIHVPKDRFVPAELITIIDNFNQLLERTAKAKFAELEAITRVADSILIAKPCGTITYVNEAGLRTIGNVVGENLKNLIDRSAISTIFFEGTPREWKGDVAIHKPDGSRFDGFLSATPIFDKDRVTTVVAIIQDITKEKAARDSLMQSEKMITLGELVAGTSHELNNPLAIVTGYSDLLLDEPGLTTEQRSKIESIRKSAMRASSVVHSLLAFARKRRAERVRTNVNEVIEAAAELKDYDLTTSGIRFEKNLARHLPPVYADPNQLQQVLLNVINNAQDAVALGEDPAIVLSTAGRESTVLITVRDNGPGIPKSEIKKVFDPFFTTKPVGKGTGLGLSISYGIIREHNGEISIRSDLGEGTVVTIELPIDRHELQPLTRPPVNESVVRSMRVLVVDDEIDIVSILRSGLARSGVTVDSACTVSDAVSLASTISYDFVLTDVKMPGGSGIDLYKQLCDVNPLYRRRTVFLTGDVSNPTTIKFLEKEGLMYFSKPFDFDLMERYLKETALS